jgi:hypothetical protein
MKVLIFIFALILVIVVILLILKHVSIDDKLRDELSALPEKYFQFKDSIISEKDISDFPLSVQKFFRVRGLIGKPLYTNGMCRFSGDFKMAIDQPWIKVETVQFNSFVEPLRIFIIRADKWGLFSMIGRDIYQNGRGNMTGKLMRLITIFDEKGEAFDTGELTTYLNDAFFLFPWVLIHQKDSLRWEELSERSVRVYFTDKQQTVQADIHFDEQGRLANYVTDDRFLNRNPAEPHEYIRTRWSTPVSAYQEIKGISIPTYGEAVWHYDDIHYKYAKFKLQDITFNITR